MNASAEKEGEMTKKKPLEQVIEMATEFVEKQRGAWDHDAWLAFLERVKQEGVELTRELSDSLGQLLESIKPLYSTATRTDGLEHALTDLAKRSLTFVKNSKGAWDDLGWRRFLDDVQQAGHTLTDEATRYVGGILEAARSLAHVDEEAPGAAVKPEAGDGAADGAPTKKKDEKKAAKAKKSTSSKSPSATR